MSDQLSQYYNKSVLVTGAGGFIGSHLVEALIEVGAKVTALVKYNSQNSWGKLEEISQKNIKKCEVVLGDITDISLVRSLIKNQMTVFHLAALIGIPYSYVAPMSYLRTNIEGTVNMLEAARDCKIHRFIHTSTSETYGTAIYTPIDEKHPLQGQSPYSASKIAADKMVESYYRSFDLPAVTIRPFNTFGPRQSARAIVPTIVSQLLCGVKELSLGSLDPVRDMTYVNDTVRGFMLAGVTHSDCLGETINLGTGVGYSIAQIVETLQTIIGSNVPIKKDKARVRPNKSEVMKLISDNSKAKTMLNWTPTYSLEEGLEGVVNYIKRYLSDYKIDQYII